ncbi:hypothetical protein FPZ12_022205 [Amycolatopsis acidicola]|uniref:Uncharacterized protein n=1 Tax=Amycolatopsis acidicola TaxID=2596893 RepID=A0A5N0V2B9_9PSEU|nr:hypothetical protein [Amycolatopsis acidicola]KAA9158557.1 hypothetical protein FPZ12_022205 [Amycolatopsis acidicola]
MGNRSGEEIAEAVAYVCEHGDSLRATLAGGPAEGLRQLDELLAALRAGADPAEHLEAVHRALRRAQDALGVFGRTRDASMITLAGIERDRPHEPVLLCPRASHPCARFAWPGRGEPPVCEVTGAHLRRATLAP